MSATAKTAYFVRTAVRSVWRAPFVHLIAVATLWLALASFGAARVAQTQLKALVSSLGGEVEFTVYARADASRAQLDELATALGNRTGGAATVVAPEEAISRLKKELELEGLDAEGLAGAALPYSLELKLPPGQRTPELLADLAQKTRALPFVAQVDYGEAALRRLTALTRGLELAGLVVFALVFLTAIIVVSATLQLAIFARREEIEIQKLVGATDRFVRLPFLIEGALEGLVAAVLSVASLYGVAVALEAGALDGLGMLALSGKLDVDWRRVALEQLVVGSLLGIIGSFVAVRRFLRV